MIGRSQCGPVRVSRTAAQVAWMLKRPFAASQIQTRPGPGGKSLSYVTSRDVMRRLDDAVGADGWQTEFTAAGADKVICQLSVRYGDRWISKSDGAGATDIEGDKGCFADAFKRAAVQHGIARHLYYSTQITPEQYDERIPYPETDNGL